MAFLLWSEWAIVVPTGGKRREAVRDPFTQHWSAGNKGMWDFQSLTMLAWREDSVCWRNVRRARQASFEKHLPRVLWILRDIEKSAL